VPEIEQRLQRLLRGRPRRAQERILHEARRQRQGCREHDDLVLARVDGAHPLSTPRDSGRPLVRAGEGGARRRARPARTSAIGRIAMSVSYEWP
jgi:hypothetical protein